MEPYRLSLCSNKRATQRAGLNRWQIHARQCLQRRRVALLEEIRPQRAAIRQHLNRNPTLLGLLDQCE